MNGEHPPFKATVTTYYVVVVKQFAASVRSFAQAVTVKVFEYSVSFVAVI